MRLRPLVLGTFLAAIAAGWFLAAIKGGASPFEANAKAKGELVVHEWGTFLAMNGSDGVALDGMYHEEHGLPAFVHARGREQLRIPSVILKGETPVIYFYTNQAQKVRVDVRFPRGTWTQWYPQAQVVGPQFAQAGSPADPRDGRILWCAELLPAGIGKPSPGLPETSSDALWNFARDVDAAYVRTPNRTKEKETFETERFLFYRGLGKAALPLALKADAGGTLGLDESGPKGVRHVFVIRVEGGKAAYAYRAGIAPGEQVSGVIPAMDRAKPIAEVVPALADDLAARLVESGLYAKEARAMVNTWRQSYFQTEGVRALFVLPQSWTDAFIPMTLTPAPKELVRVMVGRLELLTPGRERLIEAAVRDLAAPEAPARRRAFDALREQGRYAEPILRRVLKTTSDEGVRARCKQLLAADFVTELRAAIGAAADGKRLVEEPVHVRAQLASLLHEIGLHDQAKAEAKEVVAALRAMPRPSMTHHESRKYLRSYARAMEGLGDAEGAANWYETFARFGSQVAATENCRGCHRDAGPRDMAWFRDWWAGPKYARAVARSGRLDSAIAEQEAALAKRPDDVAARLLSAYLYAEKGQPTKAAAAWGRIDPRVTVSLNRGAGQ